MAELMEGMTAVELVDATVAWMAGSKDYSSAALSAAMKAGTRAAWMADKKVYSAAAEQVVCWA